MNLYKLNRATHRDFGYFFTAMTIIYALSGIALNHRKDWNPNYIIERTEHQVNIPPDLQTNEKTAVEAILKQIDQQDNYRKYYFPTSGELKVFMNGGGTIVVNLASGKLLFENLTKRPIFNQVNFLHYNPGKLWMWFSDFFCVALIVLAISGLFILKGKNGITRRGAWLTAAGIIVPIVFLLMYY
jgi:uncharacterized protein